MAKKKEVNNPTKNIHSKNTANSIVTNNNSDQLNFLVNELDKLKNKITELNIIDQTTQEIKIDSTKIEEKNYSIDDSKLNNSFLQKQRLDFFKEKVQELIEINKRKENLISFKEKEIQDLKLRIYQLSKQQKEDSKIIHDNYSSSAKTISSLKENYHKTISEKNQIIHDLSKKINNLSSELNTIKHNLDNVELTEITIKKKEESFRQKILEKEQIISRLETDILRLKGILDKNFSSESDLKGKLFIKDKELKDQNFKLKEIQQKESKVRLDIKGLSTRVNDLNQKLYLSENEIKFKNKAIQKVIHEIKNLENLNKSKNIVLEKLQQANRKIQIENNNLAVKNENFINHLKRKEKYIIEIENEIGIKRIKLESSKKAIDKLLNENNFLRKTLKETTQKLSRENINLDKDFAKYKKDHLIELKNIKEEYENRINELIKQNTDSEIALKLRIENLNEIIGEQNNLIEEKREKEKQIAIEFTSKIKEMLMLGSSKIKNLKEFNLDNMFHEYKDESIKQSEEINLEKENFKKKLGLEQKTQNHIKPLVKLALEHGEKPEKIIRTLSTSGYSVQDVKDALNDVLEKK